MKKILLLFVTLLTLVQGTWAANYITDVMVVGADDDDEAEAYYDYYTSQGWSGIFKDLNNNGGGHYIYLLYKTNNSRGSSGKAINNLYLWVSEHDNAPNSFVHNGRTYYLAGYDGDGTFKAKRGDLNCGAGGYWIRLFYTKDDGEYACVTNLSIDNSKGGLWVKTAATRPATSIKMPAATTSSCTSAGVWSPTIPTYIPAGNCKKWHRSATSTSA